jgi:hypothetical protein
MCLLFLYICLLMNKFKNMPKFHNLTILFLLVSFQMTQAQSSFSPEIGVIVGPVAFQSDYGERHDFDTNSGNTGFGIGLVYYLNFSYLRNYNFLNPNTYFREHFKARFELSYNRTKFNFFGTFVTPEKLATSDISRKLKAMEGTTSVANLGAQFEFYPFETIKYFESSVGSYAPFVSLGGQFSYYNPEIHSTLGPLGTTATTIPKYLEPSEGKIHGYTNDGGAVFSIVSSIGTRYKLTRMSDLMLDLRAQYYFSNWVDGLNPNPDKYTENRANDWNIWLNVGYIYYLDN